MATAQTVGLACDTTCIAMCLEPGTYFFLIQPSGPAGSVNCANGDYVAHLECHPCIPCPQCDPAAMQEGEPCPNYPDTFNGGCNPGGEFVSPIQCGVEVCGTSWAYPITPSYNAQDVDVYELVLTQYDSVVWRVQSNTSAQIFITEPLPGCGGEIVWAQSIYGQKCDSLVAGVCLPPGRYWLKIMAYSLPGYCEPYNARVDCYPCSPGCVVCPLSGTSIPEGEPCPNWNDQYNAGCFSTPVSAVNIQCGDTICGSGLYIDIPDRDFYQITLTQRDTVTWCVTADFAVAAAIMTPTTNCSSIITHAQGNAPACVPLCLQVCLDPGTYWLHVRPTSSADFPYPHACKPYVASVHCAPCPGGSQPCTYADLDFDPANNACSFGNIQLSCGDTVCGEIIQGAAPDQDWYTFYVAPGTPCVRLVSNVYGDDTPGFYPFGLGLDPAIALYQADCVTQIAFDNNSGTGNDALMMTPCLAPGWYHIRVGGVAGSVGPYVLTLFCSPCPCPPPCPFQSRDFEPLNNTCTTAPAEFVCGDTLCGELPLGPAVDEDWYQFWVFGPQCQRLTLDVFANGTPGYFGYLAGLDPIVELWNGTCTTLLATDDNSGVGNDAQLISVCLQPGQYRIRISAVGGTTGPYVLAASCQFCNCSGQCPYPDMDFDPANDNCGQNVTLSCGDTLCGDVLPGNAGLPPDNDWYQVVVPAGGCFSLVIDAFANSTPAYSPFGGGLDPTVWLYGADCSTLLEFDNDSGVGTDSRLTSGCLTSGVYNILINSPSGTSGPYILAINCVQCTCPCSLACPPTIPSEGEPCPNLYGSFNEGCLTNPPTFSPVTCGSTWCGGSWAMGGMRDTDWYQLNLATARRIKWTVNAEFPFEMAIYKPNPNCSSLQTIRYATAAACQTRVVNVLCLPAGTYYFYVAPTVLNGVPCGSEYRSRLQCGLCIIHHVVIHLEGTSIKLLWEPDETAPVYNIHRSTTEDFEPSDQTLIGTSTEPFFEDQNVVQSGAVKYFYVVTMDSPDVEAP